MTGEAKPMTWAEFVDAYKPTRDELRQLLDAWSDEEITEVSSVTQEMANQHTDPEPV